MRLKRMSMVRKPFFRILGMLFFMGFTMIFVCAQLAWCTATGSISGVVRDPSDAAVPGCEVVALNTGTDIKRTVSTNAQGFYLFEALPLGTYEVEVNKAGFKRYRETGLVVNVNSALVVDTRLEVGEIRQQVSVSSTAVHVDTTSTQMGEVITGATMTAVPLNGRSYVDLLALQTGVTPEASSQGSPEFGEVAGYGETSAPFQSSSFSAAGNLAINGNQETSNAFMVNGALVNDVVQQGTALVPNLDSIAEFRIMTNGYEAQYGNYGGGQINIVTKSGTNQFHGDAFDFIRNTDLNARNFFSPSIGPYHQNQFGGTVGGPMVRNKVFFFADYQGTRQVIGVDTGDIAVPSAQDRTGNFSDIASSLTGTVNGAGWAGVLSQRLGYAVANGEPYYTAGCTTSAQCVFPNAIIPMMAWDSPASKLMGFIPSPNVGSNFFSTSANKQTFDDSETSYRVDGQSRWGMLSGY
ncbi:MAG TPA: carboxypeptidase-like regulatory domain-containing protein, partial [Terriglobia bacterium]|nr:carboxypeptidase-like regulatory domain-containing protein [Terriglobia bacterium]